MHLVGVKSMTLEQLKSYHSAKIDSVCPGHPEIENEGIEVTTGPLGQGLANAVGLAMATKNLAATYNKPGHELVNNMTWCMVGDACLQEGVGLEALSLAGHWKLNNLCVIFDNNSVTCDGTADVANTEDINTKMRATGFNVVDVYNGDSDVSGKSLRPLVLVMKTFLTDISRRKGPCCRSVKRQAQLHQHSHHDWFWSHKGRHCRRTRSCSRGRRSG